MACKENEKLLKTKRIINIYLNSHKYDMLQKVKNELKRSLQSDLNNGKLNEGEYNILMEYLESEINKLYHTEKVKTNTEDSKTKTETERLRKEFQKSVLAKISEEDKRVFAEKKKKEIDILMEKEKQQDLPRMARKSDVYNGAMITITPKEEKFESKGEER